MSLPQPRAGSRPGGPSPGLGGSLKEGVFKQKHAGGYQDWGVTVLWSEAPGDSLASPGSKRLSFANSPVTVTSWARLPSHWSWLCAHCVRTPSSPSQRTPLPLYSLPLGREGSLPRSPVERHRTEPRPEPGSGPASTRLGLRWTERDGPAARAKGAWIVKALPG